MIDAVIFDFDGVIADSEVLHFRAFNYVLNKFGVEISREDYYQNYLGLNDFDLFQLLVDAGHLDVKVDQLKDLIKEKNVYFEELAETESSIIDGVREFIELLNKNEVPMAICSGALLSEIKMMLADNQLDEYFETIVSAEHVHKGKPFPEGFLLAMDRLNEKLDREIKAKRCVVIEDSPWGLKAAIAAGMHTVAITNSYQPESLTMADKIIDHLSELDVGQLNELCD